MAVAGYRVLVLAAALLLPAAGAGAVIVLDSTWRAEGGAPGREADGFGAHIRLAHAPQFRGLLSLSEDGGDSWGSASGTWIGNDAGHGYVLTAAHIFDEDDSPGSYLYRADDGTVYRADRVTVHPAWTGDYDVRSGYDLAVVRLARPVTGLGPPPLLYAGSREAGRLLTFVGFGSRGIGSAGQQDRYHTGSDKAAAQGLVEEVVPLARPLPDEGDGGGYLGIFLPREDGGIDGPYGGPTRPVSRHAGLLGSGDSGGSAWIELDGRWLIAGINSNGSEAAVYGDQSWFTRVSDQRAWILAQFPAARFSDGSADAPQAAVAVGKPAVAVARKPICTPGSAVDVLWKGDWYPARVRARAGSKGCPIRYDEFGEEWDEAVRPDRLRRPR